MWRMNGSTEPAFQHTQKVMLCAPYTQIHMNQVSIDHTVNTENDSRVLAVYLLLLPLPTGGVKVTQLSHHEHSQHFTLRWNGMESCLSCGAIQATALTGHGGVPVTSSEQAGNTVSLSFPRRAMCFSPDPSSLLPICRSPRYLHYCIWRSRQTLTNVLCLASFKRRKTCFTYKMSTFQELKAIDLELRNGNFTPKSNNNYHEIMSELVKTTNRLNPSLAQINEQTKKVCETVSCLSKPLRRWGSYVKRVQLWVTLGDFLTLISHPELRQTDVYKNMMEV